MQIVKTAEIDRPIDEVWSVLGENFAHGYQWMSAIPLSYAKEDTSEVDGTVSGRICELTKKGASGPLADETITLFDEENHTLNIDVNFKNTPPGFPVKNNKVVMRLEKISDTRTRYVFESDLTVSGFAALFSPILKIGLGKGFAQIATDLKTHMESLPKAA